MQNWARKSQLTKVKNIIHTCSDLNQLLSAIMQIRKQNTNRNDEKNVQRKYAFAPEQMLVSSSIVLDFGSKFNCLVTKVHELSLSAHVK